MDNALKKKVLRILSDLNLEEMRDVLSLMIEEFKSRYFSKTKSRYSKANIDALINEVLHKTDDMSDEQILRISVIGVFADLKKYIRKL